MLVKIVFTRTHLQPLWRCFWEYFALLVKHMLIPVITKGIMYQNNLFLILSIFYGKTINYFILIYYKCKTGHSRKQLLAIWQASLVITRQVNSFMVKFSFKIKQEVCILDRTGIKNSYFTKNNGTEHSNASPDHYVCSNLTNTNTESILHVFLQIKER